MPNSPLTGRPELARELAAARETSTFACEACGEPFTAIARSGNRRPRTCSPRCRTALHRAERRAELAADH